MSTRAEVDKVRVRRGDSRSLDFERGTANRSCRHGTRQTLTLFVTPVFYVYFENLRSPWPKSTPETRQPPGGPTSLLAPALLPVRERLTMMAAPAGGGASPSSGATGRGSWRTMCRSAIGVIRSR